MAINHAAVAPRIQFDQSSLSEEIPTPFKIFVLTLLEIATQPGSRICLGLVVGPTHVISDRNTKKKKKKKSNGKIDSADFDEEFSERGEEEEEFKMKEEKMALADEESAFGSLTVRFRKLLVRFVRDLIFVQDNENNNNNTNDCRNDSLLDAAVEGELVLRELDMEEAYRKLYSFLVHEMIKKTKKKKEREDAEEMNMINDNEEDFVSSRDDIEDDDDDYDEDVAREQIEDFFHVVLESERAKLESVDELVRKFSESYPKIIARDGKDAYVSNEDLAVRRIDPETIVGRFVRQQIVFFERLSFEAVCKCHDNLKRYRDDFDAYVESYADGLKAVLNKALFHKMSKPNERKLVDKLVDKCERLGRKDLLLGVDNDDDHRRSKDYYFEDDEKLPFGVAMGLGGILPRRENSNNNYNRTSTSKTTTTSETLRSVLQEHEKSVFPHNRHSRAKHVESLKQKDLLGALFHLHRHYENNGDIAADESILAHEMIHAQYSSVAQSGKRAAEALIALGATHAQFQHRKETARALEEATRVAQASGDEDALAKALALSGLLAESEYFDSNTDASYYEEYFDAVDSDDDDDGEANYNMNEDLHKVERTQKENIDINNNEISSMTSVLKRAKRSRTLLRRCLKLGRQLKNPALASYAELALARQAAEFPSDYSSIRDQQEERRMMAANKNAATTSLVSASQSTITSAPEVVERAIQNVEVLAHRTTLVASAPATRPTAEHMKRQEMILREKGAAAAEANQQPGGANAAQQQGGNQTLDAVAVAQATALIRMNEIYPASATTITSLSNSVNGKDGSNFHTSLGTLQRYAVFEKAKETKNAINCLRTPAFSLQSTTWTTRGEDGLARIATLKAVSEETIKDASPVDAARAFAVLAKTVQSTKGTEQASIEINKAENRLQKHLGGDFPEVSRELAAARVSVSFDDAVARNDCFEASECMRQMQALVHPMGENTDASAVLEANRALAEVLSMSGNFPEAFETFLKGADILTFSSQSLNAENSKKTSTTDPRNALHVLKSELGIAATFKRSKNYAFALLRALGVDKRATDLGVDQFALYAKLLIAECLIELKGSHASLGKLYLEKHAVAFLASNELRLRARFHLVNAKSSLVVVVDLEKENEDEEENESIESIVDDLSRAIDFGEKLKSLEIIRECQYLLARIFHATGDCEKRNHHSREFRKITKSIASSSS